MGSPTFSPPFTSHDYKSASIIPQWIKETNVVITWSDWYVIFSGYFTRLSNLNLFLIPFFIILGAVHGIVNIDCKKRSEAERASFDFRIKKVSVYGIDDDILEEVRKFPFPFQHVMIKEACAVLDRLKKEKMCQV